ncbi:hypothetical protein Tco_0852772 [Tanacetum coccineum]
MDGTAWIFLWTGRLMIPLHGKGDLTTIKSSGHSWDHSTFHFRAESIEAVFIKVFETDPPSTYIWWMRWHLTSASITIGISYPSLFARGGKEISGFVEKL